MPSFYGENPPDTEVGTTDATESQISEDAVTETDTSGGFYQGSPTQTTTEAFENDARQAAEAAEAAQEAAEDAQAAAEASESAASSSESNAASSQSAAAASASNASLNAAAAAGHATTAGIKQTQASLSALAAADSASDAASSESSAASSASAAASSASSASASETSAASSAGTASTKASEAATSATNAAASESAAASSETNSFNNSAAAAGSATSAALSKTAAAVSAAAASTSASNAATSASDAASSASSASSSATSAASSASSASTSATAAGSARDAALAALDSFDDRYLGQKSSEPSVDNDGNALVAGALFFDTVNTVMKVYDGSQWLAAYASVSGALLAINNLDDVSNTATARSNLGLGTAAEQNVGYFATAAQGSLADSALQNGDNVSVLTNDAGYATTTYVDNEVAGLVDSAPATLDTLNELAAALGDDANFSTTVTNSIATKWTQDNTKISNWDTAYGWGNHASAGYLTGNQTITLTGDVSGSGTTSISVTVANDSHTHDGRYYTESEADSRFLRANGGTTGSFIDLFRNVDTGVGGYIDFREGAAQDIRLGVNVFDGELPEAGTALILDRVGSGNGDAHLVVHGNIYANHGGTPSSANRVYTTAYHPEADKWTTARTLSLTGAVTGSVSVDGSGNVSLATTATSDPTLTLTGDVTGSATFTNLGNATLTATVANDSHTHDGRYYTESEADARFLRGNTSDTMSGTFEATGDIQAVGGYTNLSSYTSGTVPTTVGMVDIRSGGKTGWAPGDELGKVRWYANDTSGNWPGEVASIRAVNQNGNGSTTTVGSAALEFYTSPYNSITQSMALRLDKDQTADFQNSIKMGGTTVIDSSRNLTNIGGGAHKAFIGAADFSWGGSSAYPTIYGSHSDRWVMITFPHIPYLQNGSRGFTGTTTGSIIRHEGDISQTTTWYAGVKSNVGANTYSITKNTGSDWALRITSSAMRVDAKNGFDVNGTTVIDSSRNIDNVPSVTTTSATVGGVTMRASADRAGLLEILDAGGSWSGIQITRDEGDHWSVMGSPDSFGLYDDHNSDWILLHDQLGSTTLYHAGNAKISTTSSGVSVTGAVQVGGTTVIDSSRNLTNIGGISADSAYFGAGVTIRESTTRSDLLEIVSNTTGWGGLSITNSSNEGVWSLMVNGANAGLYDEQNAHWHVYASENAGTSLWHNGTSRLETTSSGVNVAGGLEISGTTVIDSSRNLTNIANITANDTSVGGLTVRSSTNDCLNFDGGSAGDHRGIAFNSRTALSADVSDGWLRLNSQSEFTNGVFTPGNVRIDGNLDVAEYIRHESDTNTYIRFIAADDMQLVAGARQMIRMDEGTNPDRLYFPNGSSYTDSNGDAVFAGNVTAYASDRRLKTRIKPIENALAKVMAIRGVTYDWIEGVEDLGFVPGRKNDCMGVIAQELEEAGVDQVIMPAPFDRMRSKETNWEDVSRSGEEYKTVDYDKLTALLIEAVKEQQTQINALQAKIEELENGNH